MPDSKPTLSSIKGRMSIPLVLSYVVDWFVVIAMGFVALGLGLLEPNKRPFALDDPNIAFRFTEDETIPSWLLILCIAFIPAGIVLVVCLIFVPGATVPKNASKGLVWRRKLWELNTGLLGLALSVVIAFFFTNGMKQLFGKPRPDLLDRCEPDLDNREQYLISSLGIAGPAIGRLYSADICKSTDTDRLDDGFRSYPSGHSSSAAAGLVYLTLFLASKFAVVVPFVAPSDYSSSGSSHVAFPSRLADEASRLRDFDDRSATSSPTANGGPTAQHNSHLSSIRLRSAAPPVYLLVIVLIPFGASIFIAASRWYDFRHHGFDILFGYLMGFFAAIYSFRYYHLPIQAGAGWAWGPRSSDRAFWAGVGRLGYVTDRDAAPATSRAETTAFAEPQPQPFYPPRNGHPMNGLSDSNTAYAPSAEHMIQRNAPRGPFHDVEMQPIETNRI